MAEELTTRAGLALRTLHEETRSVTFIASTDALDSYDEIVEQTWRLSRFKANPVILFAHNSRELPIGQATRCEVVGGKLEADIAFLSAEANPKAEQVWQCLKAGALRAVSVGFIPKDVRREVRNGQDVYVLGDNELFEISVTPTPANPEALARMRSKARASASPEGKGAPAPHEEHMNYALIIATLAMSASATENDVVSAVKSTKEKADKFDAAEAELTSAKAKLATVETEKATLTTERDAANERAKKAEMGLVSFELDALIGTKIIPAEKEALLELASVNRGIFDKQMVAIKARGDMALKGQTMREAGTMAPATSTGGGGDNGAALANMSSAASA